MKTYIGLFLCALSCLICSAEDENARLLAAKNILGEMFVEQKELSVEYNIYNVGGSAALEVELKDDSFSKDDFEISHGNTQVQWARIAPGGNVSHVVVVKPIRAGIVNFTHAEVKYQTGTEGGEKQIGYTSAPGEARVMNFREYDRKFSPHVTDWAVFGLMTLPSLGMPFLLWYSSKSKYEGVSKSKKN